jgi:hypothetical protein
VIDLPPVLHVTAQSALWNSGEPEGTMRAHLFIVMLLALALSTAGCQGDTVLTGPTLLGDDDDSAGIDDEDLYPEFDGATMVVHAPVSAAIYPLEDDLELEAEILDVDGEPLDFEDIVWEIDSDDDPIFVGDQGDVEMDWGIHTFTVTADLPNGDRLQTVLGGVRVQSENTGIYAGNFALNVHAEYQGTPITASCLGGLAFVVGMSGETLDAEGGQCTINLIIMGEMDVSYGVEGEVDDGDVDGNIQLDLGFFDLPVGYEGELSDGEMYAEYAGSAILFEFDGSLEATRVSEYVDP